MAVEPREVKDVPLQDYLQRGWTLFKDNMGIVLMVFIGIVLIQFTIPRVVPFGSLITFVLYGPMQCGLYFALIKLKQGQPWNFENLLEGFRYFAPCLLVGVITGVFTMVGFLLLILPGIFVLTLYLFALCLVVDKKLDFWDAMEISRKTVMSNLVGFLLLTLALVAVNVLGFLAFVVGIIFTAPFSVCVITCVYTDIFGDAQVVQAVEEAPAE